MSAEHVRRPETDRATRMTSPSGITVGMLYQNSEGAISHNGGEIFLLTKT